MSRWWEAKITCHIEAETRDEADEVVTVLFDQDSVQGGSWQCVEITDEDYCETCSEFFLPILGVHGCPFCDPKGRLGAKRQAA